MFNKQNIRKSIEMDFGDFFSDNITREIPGIMGSQSIRYIEKIKDSHERSKSQGEVIIGSNPLDVKGS